MDEDLAGTWTLDGNSVTFSQTADTFIGDVEFAAGPNSLTASGVFQATTLHIVLTKGG